MAKLIKDMPASEYHAIKALSASGAKLLLRSPAHYLESMTNPREPSAAMKLGTLTHTLFFEPEKFEQEFAISPRFDMRTTIGKKAAQEFQDDNQGKTILDEAQYSRAKAIASAAQENPVVKEYFEESGDAEVTMLWDQHKVPCKARVDFLCGDVMLDLKTCQDASPEGFARQIATYKYHLQAAHYADGFLAVSGIELKKFVFIAVESEAPHAVGIYELDAKSLLAGKRAMREAADAYILATDKPQKRYYYTRGVQTISIPQWALGEPFEI